MTLSEYKEKLLSEVNLFMEFYKRGIENNSTEFPTILPHVEWDEQFRMWQDMQDS